MGESRTSMNHSKNLFLLALGKVSAPECLLFAIVSIYSILFSYWTVNHSVGWITTGWDDGAYNQLMFNSLQGRWFEGSLEMNALGVTRLGQHFTPSMVLLLPFYAIHPKTETLLIIQTFLMSLSAVLVYFLALNLTHRKWISLVLSVSFLLHPGIQAINRVSFHEVCLAPPLLLVTLILYENKQYLFSLIPLILLCFVKEDMPLLAIGLGLFIIFGKRSLKWGGTYLFLGMLCFTAVHFFFMPKLEEWRSLYNSGYDYAYAYSYRYSDLLGESEGGTMGEMLISILRNPGRVIRIIFSWDKMLFFAALFLPLGILPLLAPACLLIALPNLLTLLLSNEEWMYSFNAYYAGAFTPAFYYGSCLTIGNKRITASQLPKSAFWSKLSSFRLVLFQILLGTTFIFTLICWPLLKPIATLPKPSPQVEYVKSLLHTIPPDAAVGSTPRYASYLSSRYEVWAYDPMTSVTRLDFDSNERSMKLALEKANWLFIDSSEPVNPKIGNDRYYREFYDAVRAKRWCIHFSDEKYLIARKATDQQQCRSKPAADASVAASLLESESILDTYEAASKTVLNSELNSFNDWDQVAGDFAISNVTNAEATALKIEKTSGEQDARLETSFVRVMPVPPVKGNITKDVYTVTLTARSLNDAESRLTLGCSDGVSQSTEQSFQLINRYLEKNFVCPMIGSRSERIYVYISFPQDIGFAAKGIEIAHVDKER